MTYKRFNELFKDALQEPDKDMYIAQYGYPKWFDEISSDVDEIVRNLRTIHYIAQADFREIVKKSGMTQKQFSERFCIPKRTIEQWCENIRECKPYLRLLICKDLGLLDDIVIG